MPALKDEETATSGAYKDLPPNHLMSHSLTSRVDITVVCKVAVEAKEQMSMRSSIVLFPLIFQITLKL